MSEPEGAIGKEQLEKSEDDLNTRKLRRQVIIGTLAVTAITLAAGVPFLIHRKAEEERQLNSIPSCEKLETGHETLISINQDTVDAILALAKAAPSLGLQACHGEHGRYLRLEMPRGR